MPSEGSLLVIIPIFLRCVDDKADKAIVSPIANINYTLSAIIYDDPERFQEYMEVIFTINDYEVFAVIG